MKSRAANHRRSFVLISVLILVSIAILVVTGLLHLAQSQTAAFAMSGASVQARSTAWSGVQVIMTTLGEQREVILDGELPQLDGQYTIYEFAGRMGIVRVLPTRSGSRMSSEAGKIDLNGATVQTLLDTDWIEDDVAQAIIAHRDQRGGFDSVSDLLEVEGVTPELLLGPIDEIRSTDDALGEEAELADRVQLRLSGEEIHGLIDLFTVHAVEPALQRNGKLRINLNVPWSDELGERLDERFGEGTGPMAKGIFESGFAFDGEAAVYQLMNRAGTPVEDWSNIVDALTTEEGQFHFGRMDINTAPVEALQTLPGIDPEIAADIVHVREGLTADDRATVVWPILEGILEREAYNELGGRITSRSWTFRVRIAAGEVDEDAADGPIENPAIYELIIDMAGPTPRLAYLRDITLLQTAALIALHAPERDEIDRFEDVEETPANGGAGESGGEGKDGRDTETDSDPFASETEMDGETNGGDPDAAPAPPAPAEDHSEPRRVGRWHS